MMKKMLMIHPTPTRLSEIKNCNFRALVSCTHFLFTVLFYHLPLDCKCIFVHISCREQSFLLCSLVENKFGKECYSTVEKCCCEFRSKIFFLSRLPNFNFSLLELSMPGICNILEFFFSNSL